MKRLLTVALLVALAPSPAAAHDGPPYPILVDQKAGPYVLNVWADPDVGTGTFYVTPEGRPPLELEVEVWVQPDDRRLPEARYAARRRQGRERETYVVEARFPTQEWWHARVVVKGAAGAGALATRVEVTPPGLGPLDLLLYLSPFLAVAFLWIKAVLRRRIRPTG